MRRYGEKECIAPMQHHAKVQQSCLEEGFLLVAPARQKVFLASNLRYEFLTKRAEASFAYAILYSRGGTHPWQDEVGFGSIPSECVPSAPSRLHLEIRRLVA
jgi:hypothetical protein